MSSNFASLETPPHGALSWKALAALLAFASLVRGGVLVAQRENLRDDPDAYAIIAKNLARDGVYSRRQTNQRSTDRSASLDPDWDPATLPPTAYRPPIYPVLLSNLAPGGELSIGGVAILHFVLGLATVLSTLHVARLWGLGGWSLIAAALVAVDPILLNQSTLAMTETPAALLAVISLYCLTRFSAAPTPFNAALAGGALALAALCRPTFLPWLALVAIAALITGGSWRRRGINVVVLVVVAAAVMAPWTIRNYWLSGKPIYATTHGGYTLWLGNNPSFYEYLREGRWGETWDAESYNRQQQWLGIPRAAALAGPLVPGIEQEADLDKRYYQQAWQNIRAEPKMFAWSCLVRVGRLWGLVPHQLSGDESLARRLLRYTIGAWYAMLFLLAIVGIARLRGRLLKTPWVWGVLLCVAFTAMHALYWSNLRMRAPLMPFVCLAAAVGAAVACERILRRKSPS